MTDSGWSQSGEEPMILEWADRHGPGRWLDLGAYDGATASNTRALALAGWPGVAVEPSALPFRRLADLYADRPDVECVQAAIMPTPGLHRFHMTDDMVSTADDANAETWSELAAFTPVYVAAVTVADLLATLPGPYDFVSVDVEGLSVEMWDELRRFGAFAPGALACIEAEDGGERWEIQTACLEGWARIGVTPQNVLLEKL